MKDETINGFSRNEIFSLYRFLCLYECSRMKFLNKAELFKQYPKMEEIETILAHINYKEKTKKELQVMDVDALDNEFYFTEFGSKLHGVFYHLRNSIAHANIIKNGDVVSIKDFENKKTDAECTAKGIIPFKTIEAILAKMQEVFN
jgi:hypothetical protein